MAFRKLGVGSRQKCFTKPFRSKPRLYSAKDVGRIACKAREAGWTELELLEELSACAPCKERRSKRQQARLEQVLALDNAVMGDAELIMKAVDAALQGFLLLSRFVPMLRAQSIILLQVRKPVAAVVTRLGARRAANDELFAQILKEAS